MPAYEKERVRYAISNWNAVGVTYNTEDTALGLSSRLGTDLGEVLAILGGLSRDLAVEVCNTGNVGRAALSRAVEARGADSGVAATTSLVTTAVTAVTTAAARVTSFTLSTLDTNATALDRVGGSAHGGEEGNDEGFVEDHFCGWFSRMKRVVEVFDQRMN